jgi:hypothetical protein
LDDATLADRVDEVAELIIAEFGAGLKRAGNDLVETDLLDAFAMFLGGNRGRDAGVDKGSKPFAKTLSKPFAKGLLAVVSAR